MSQNSLTEPNQPKKKHATSTAQLKVVFDTNALYVTQNSLGSASDLVRSEISDLISKAKYPDLLISWYLPDIVRHERQYQMQGEALRLRGSINKIERLLGHNLALTDQVLLDHVKGKIDESESLLGLQEIVLDHSTVDWGRVIHASAYRLPPFQAGEKEKGFRDALVTECFLQLIATSPKTPKICRVVLVTSDELLAEAAEKRIASASNASVLLSIEELKGLINTIISNVDEEVINFLKPKAAQLFFVPEAKETLYYKEKIREKIVSGFKSELNAKPEGTVFRDDGTWYVNQPNFVKKEGSRIFWTSRIEIAFEAGSVTREESKGIGIADLSSGLLTVRPQDVSGFGLSPKPQTLGSLWGAAYATGPSPNLGYGSILSTPLEKKIPTHKGRDSYEVLWSAEVNVRKQLKKTKFEEIKHIELTSQPIS